MKEHPIIFNGSMVRAILAGKKTQTRRVIKKALGAKSLYAGERDGLWVVDRFGDATSMMIRCPFGVPGDVLWVRETFVIESDYEYYGENMPDDDRPIQKHNNDAGNYHLIPHYRATEPDVAIEPSIRMDDGMFDRTAWKPSIHMPRWAARIFLEVVSVRVERVQEITTKDADAEIFDGDFPHNVMPELFGDKPGHLSIPECFGRLWDSINAKRGFGWDVNPWVWVVEFKVVTK